MKKQYKSSRVKNHKITKKFFLRWGSLKRLRSLLSFLDLAPEIKKVLWEYPVTNEA